MRVNQPIPPSKKALVVVGSSCADIKNNIPSSANGYYAIDLDNNGPLAPIEVYCDMQTSGGGWMLFAHHTDGLDRITQTNNVTTKKFGVISSEYWVAMRENMNDGMMLLDENKRVSRISAAKLYGANCESISDLNNLTALSKDGSRHIWHHESRGCDGRGLDYSLISLTDSTTAKSYDIAGAAIYQDSSMKFDEWPYGSDGSSYKHQDTLMYFIR
ncbi:fibrinogen-like YCDxxxxGGGW domain-containing protein [Paraglaciecola aquimarina]|uniref:Fibrinogen-like YCDxxxxGGGW domain-containing protein n=1 Tax=Paraglaciecola aquimarina TaxID=1235557 RepID=A0ABU3SVC7_9ALTE|nr:fibrinogen-like YCDxxxxGGGW domain-containing protein [Paraglaciecola aquimarina]MDU0353942.1 fibrinogen-like YCDxxxxGGGW domain-containing protein [Paraglaciecola aquimarina]